MSLVRILVDGYSLLHAWAELAPGRARHSAEARDALIQKLTHYRDATGVPITIFFDGSFPRGAGPKPGSSSEVEVLFSRDGQTADQMIERAAHRFQAYGQVLAVTDDVAERDTVIAFGGLAAGCDNFISQVDAALADLARDLKHFNRAERNRFTRRH